MIIAAVSNGILRKFKLSLLGFLLHRQRKKFLIYPSFFMVFCLYSLFKKKFFKVLFFA